MLELARPRLAKGGEDWRLGFGGDTLNTAIHLARAGHNVAYLTALGCDPLSAEMKALWAAEGLDTSLVLEHPSRSTGLYAISTDDAGERSFSYWRETSAAREMLALPGSAEALAKVAQADLIAFSLITLAILPPDGRAALLDLARTMRNAGKLVAFDGNYRAKLWASSAEACAVRDAAIGCASIGLPTLEDEIAMSGLQSAQEVASHWRGLGCAETVVKLGADGCLLNDGSVVTPAHVLSPVDTSGAGDAFNAGYLDARLRGASQHEAAAAGHSLAGWTIMRPGAIPARDS